MTEREALLRKIAAKQFAIWELHIYLDTHINEPEAVKRSKKCKEELNVLVKEYENEYGPLTNDCSSTSSAWLKNPWPWDLEDDD
ncbi:MAG: spore coat protein CotJB [Clostridiales bacterium]|nr:spore coat protein CotJB [Clostridiales bacterium]